MRTVNVWPLLSAIANIEKNDLIQALNAHGGEYEFPGSDEEGGGNGPCIAAYSELNGPYSAEVLGVALLPEDGIRITVSDEEGSVFSIGYDDVYAGHLSAITAAMAEPEKNN